MTEDARPAHARLSPSAITRWSHCTASIALGDAVSPKEITTTFAEFGKRSHAEMEHYIKTGKWQNITTGETVVAQAAVKLLDEVAPEIKKLEYTVHPERRVDIRLGGLDTYGTADIIAHSKDGMHLIVADYKSGYTPVHAVENPQLAAYMLGAHQFIDKHHQEGATFTGIIMQPRVNTHVGARVSRWDASMAEILAVLEPARVAGEAIARGEYKYAVSEDSCKWCKVRGQCPAFAKYISDAVLNAAPAAGMVPDLTGIAETRLADLLRACELAPALAEAIRERALEADDGGRKIIGIEVVPGRSGPRKWISESTAERMLREKHNREYHTGEFHISKLMSPTALEKNRPDAYPAALEAVTRSEGNRTVKLADETQGKLLARGKRAAEKARLGGKLAGKATPYDSI